MGSSFSKTSNKATMRQLLGWNGSRGEMGRGGWVGF